MSRHPGHETLRQLRQGKVVDLDGLLFVMDGDGEVAAGDTYIGARNTVDVYTCKSVNTEDGWVNPEGNGYPFDTPECIKVREADEGASPDYTVPTELIAANVVRNNK